MIIADGKASVYRIYGADVVDEYLALQERLAWVRSGALFAERLTTHSKQVAA